MDDMKMAWMRALQTRWVARLEPCSVICMCANCMRKMTCEVYVSTPPWVTVDRYRLQTKPTATKDHFQKNCEHCNRRAKHGPSERRRISASEKACTPSNDTFTMLCQWIIHKFIVWHRVERTPHNVVRQNRRGGRCKSWMNSNVEALGSHDKMQKDLGNHSINDPDFTQAKRECKRAPG